MSPAGRNPVNNRVLTLNKLQMKKQVKKIDFEAITLRCEYSSRGGGIEISLDTFGKKYAGAKMTAYQNYLGGGMLGSIGNDCTIRTWRDDPKLVKIADQLARYFDSLTNPEPEYEDGDKCWESMPFEQRQALPRSAY